MDRDDKLLGASTWEQHLYDMITTHERDEEEVIEAYRGFAERTESDAVRYLIGLIIDDEERHRRVLGQLADTVRAEATFEHRGPAVPRIDVHAPDPELAEATDRFIEIERHDRDELRRLEAELTRVSGSPLAELTVALVRSDTERHITILKFIAHLARHPDRAWSSRPGRRLH